MITGPVVCLDHQRRSAIVIGVADAAKTIRYVAMNDVELKIEEDNFLHFGLRYFTTNLPIARAAAHYLHAAKCVPISSLAQQALQLLAGSEKTRALTETERQQLLDACAFTDLMDQPCRPLRPGLTPAKGPVADVKVAPAPTGRAKTGVGSYIMTKLLDAVPPEEIAQSIPRKFPGSKAGLREVKWYQHKLKKEGKLCC